MWGNTNTRRPAAVLALALALAGCSDSDAPSAAPPSSAASGTPTASAPSGTTSAPSPATSSAATSAASPSPSPTTVAVPPKKQTGTLKRGGSRTFTGTGAQLLDVQQSGQFGVVVDLDCSRCTGPVMLTEPDRIDHWADQPGPVRGQYVTSIEKNDTHPRLIVSAKGPWRVTVKDWSTSPVRKGKVTGTGSKVFVLDSKAKSLTYDFTPAGAGDSFSVRARGDVGQEMRIFGTDEASKGEVVDKIHLPAMMIIHTRGSWSVTPK